MYLSSRSTTATDGWRAVAGSNKRSSAAEEWGGPQESIDNVGEAVGAAHKLSIPAKKNKRQDN